MPHHLPHNIVSTRNNNNNNNNSLSSNLRIINRTHLIHLKHRSMRKGQIRTTRTSSSTRVVIRPTNHTSSGPIPLPLLAAVAQLREQQLQQRPRRHCPPAAVEAAIIRHSAAFVVEQRLAVAVAASTVTTAATNSRCREVKVERLNQPEGALAAVAVAEEEEQEVLTEGKIPIITHPISSTSASHTIKRRCNVEAAAVAAVVTVIATITTLITVQAIAVLTAFTISTDQETKETPIKNRDPLKDTNFIHNNNNNSHNSRGTDLNPIQIPILI